VEIFKEKNVAVYRALHSGDTGGKGACINLARLLRSDI